MPLFLLPIIQSLITLMGAHRAWALCMAIMSSPNTLRWIEELLNPVSIGSPMGGAFNAGKVVAKNASGDVLRLSSNSTVGRTVGDTIRDAVNSTHRISPRVAQLHHATWKELVRGLKNRNTTRNDVNQLFARALQNCPLNIDVSQFATRTAIRELWLGDRVAQQLANRNWILIEDGTSWIVYSTRMQRRVAVAPPHVKNAQQFEIWMNGLNPNLI